MKLGFFTACMADRSLEDVAEWAAAHGYEALEVAAWPEAGIRSHTAAHIHVQGLDQAGADRVMAMFERHRLTLSSLGFYNNNLDPDPTERQANHDHLLRCIDAAALLNCPTVGTFVGCDPTKTVAENLTDAEKVFGPIVDHAGEHGVKVVIENCVMHGWHPDGYPGNLAYSPHLWDWMIERGLYLNFDPSHLVWLGIDPVDAAKEYAAHIAHAQAKDVELLPAGRNKYGTFGITHTRDESGQIREREDPWKSGWWRYRVPGLGEVDWVRLVDALYEHGFDGTLSVEHEDAVWEGSPDRVEAGLEIAYQTLRPLLVR